MKRLRLITLLVLVAGSTVYAQPSLQRLQANLQGQRLNNAAPTEMKRTTATQAGLLFTDSSPLRLADAPQWLGQQLGFRQGIDALTTEKSTPLDNALQVNRLHQYYKGIKVEHGVANITGRSGNTTMMELEFYAIPDTFKTTPNIPEASALQKAMQFTGATHFVWQGYTGSNPAYQLPRGEKVIVRTYEDDSSVCLAWKFTIYADHPVKRSLIYVNAWTGKVVLDDPIIKHTNSTGTAATLYSGTQTITTDNAGLTPGRPYRLQEIRNGHYIVTVNYERRPYSSANDLLAVEFSDNDNNWTTAEHNANMDDAALDAHFNAEIVSDYWAEIHQRQGWDNQNGVLYSYVHVNDENTGGPMDNAFWDGSTLHLGDGAPQTTGGNPPSTSLDDIGHELGHGITSSTSGLVYRWESGALNEGFSDIWAASVTNYAKLRNVTLSTELTWRLFEKSGNPTATQPGLRDMKNPHLFGQPATYKDNFWRSTYSYQTCPVDVEDNDYCGVHRNSGVLNRWFYLITQGDNGTDPQGNGYSITGMGFGQSQKIAYLTTLNLPPNASYATARNVTINAATALYGGAVAQVVKDAWKAVGVDSGIYDMSNVPIFTTNNFTSIAVGSPGFVWAGTNYNGLYMWNGATWAKRSEIPNVRINDIKADRSGGIWVAQSGVQDASANATGGGVNYFPTPWATSIFYTRNTVPYNLPSRNARSLFIDTTRLNEGVNPKVWVATSSFIFNGTSTSGMLGQGLYNNAPAFQSVNGGLNVGTGTAVVLTVGGNKNEIWTFAQANYGVNQLLVYSATSNAFLRSYDHTTVPLIPSGFVARAIYCDAKKRFWIGLANGGVLVYDEHQQWHLINFPSVFPSGTQVNFNAISGDKYGDVYIGTTAGIIFFDHGIGEKNRIDDVQFYRRLTTQNGLPSDNINAIAFDTLRFKLWVATTAGIVQWDPPCIGNSCTIRRNHRNAESATVGSGNWSDPTIWSSGMVPDSTTNVVITDTVVVDINGHCRSLSILPPGKVQINTGLNLMIHKEEGEIIYGRQRNRSITKPK